MKTAYLDCSSGIAGNMILGALLDAGLSEPGWRRQMARLRLPVRIKVSKVKRGAFRAVHVSVQPRSESPNPQNNLKDIVRIIRRAGLGNDVTTRSIAVFDRLATAEARVHGISKNRLHFHEVGGYDCIVDIVGSVLGFQMLGIQRIYASAVNLGSGTVTFSHGTMPVPTPATAELVKGIPVYQPQSESGELTTPTGAAILKELAEQYGPMPQMRILRIGNGAGTRETPLPNTLRVLIGETGNRDSPHSPGEPVIVIETNIDDMNPELFGYVMERLFEQGALDVYLVPIYMKKCRPATLLSVIAPRTQLESLSRIILSETTSLGVRYVEMNRICLERRTVKVKTRFGSVAVKVGVSEGKMVTVAPEYESCRAAALKAKVPLKTVYAEAQRALKTLTIVD